MNTSFTRFVRLLLISVLPGVLLFDTCHGQQASTHPETPGQVFEDGSWRTPENIAEASRHDPALQEYVTRRDQTPDAFEEQVKLAHWCKARSLKDQCDAHLKRALAHRPENRRVRNLLGHVNENGVWYSPDQIANRKKQFLAARQRYRDWREPINEIASLLRSRSKDKNDSGLEKLREINDPRSVTALEAILAGVNEPIAMLAVDAINRFPEREATESIVRIALMNPSDMVREHALELLSERNRFDYLPGLIRELVSPVSTQFVIEPDANGNVFYQYVLFQQNMDKDIIRQFDLSMAQVGNAGSDWQTSMTSDAWRRANIAEARVHQLNELIDARNCLLRYSLRKTTGVDPGESPSDWWRWWYDENEIYAPERPVSYTQVREVEVSGRAQLPTGGECLVAGTPIWTARGPRPVESLRTGDRVLCKNLDLQELEYKTVLYPTTRPPTPTFQIELEGETIHASGGHLFWVKDQGWTRTRDLREGLKLQTANGSMSTIKRMQPGSVAPLFNLVVDGHANYFVGTSKVLSHDSTIPDRGEPSVERSESPQFAR